MARKPTITIEQVTAAANNIQALGVTPTSRNVREAVGGGSMNTVLKIFQQWQGGGVQQKLVIDDTLDTSIIHIINSYIADQIQEAATDLTAKLAEKQSKSNMLMSEYAQLSDEMEAKSEELSDLKTQHAELNGRFQQLEVEAKNASAELVIERQSVEDARVELAKKELLIDVVPQLQAELAKAYAELIDVRVQAAVAEAKLEVEVALRKID